ncbi:MAG: CheY-like chemotaxis protein [Sulfurimonas sp.]|jgi:CheY-like chemotaxis protein|uniref:response regulator transcription factor n=1 Tax=Sulfurimonas sp. TaxID=2022749 RepID=UPI0039E4F5AA
MHELLKDIKDFSKDITILYVEDNAGLRKNMSKFFSRVFDNVLFACDGEDGYKNFLVNRSQIVITDVNMPKSNGFQMIKKIKAIDLDVKIIILSAHDEKKHLHIAIDLGVFSYLHKPAKLPELIQALHSSVIAIREEENRRIFLSQMQNIFNYQNNLVVMMHDGNFTLSNQRFLEFFGVDDLEDFREKFPKLNEIFLEHNEFLSSNTSTSWQNIVVKNPGILFHIKVKNHKGEMRHLILKSREIPEKDGYCVLSFDDVTELNLMVLFDKKTAMGDAALKDKKSILAFFKLIKENSAKVKIHNFYRGLTIVNPAVVLGFTEEGVTLRTAFSQLKIVKLKKFMTISSRVFPQNIVCKSIKRIDADNQSITINDMSFSATTSADRKYIRLEPDEDHRCTLFYKDIKFSGDVSIFDISEVSVKLKINALPAGLYIEADIKISINITLHSKPISILTNAKVYRIDESIHNYYVVALFELETKDRDNIKSYLVDRQMTLIREFRKINIL